MGRNAASRARKRHQMHMESKSLTGGVSTLPNGQTSATDSEVIVEPQPELSVDKQAEPPFHEPLHNLPDDADSLAMLLREANAAASTGPSRLSDPRRALSLMRHCAPRLPAAQLADRLAGWCQFLGGLLRAPRQQWCRDAACRTAACLLAEEARLEEAHRLLAGGALAQIVTPLLESPDQATLASLHCLRVVLLHFGRGCGAQRSQLTQYLLQLFDGEKPAVAWAACRCVALLPHTGPSGGGGAAYAAAWAGQMRGLLRAAHAHLDRLLDGVVEVRAYEVPECGEHELELPAVSADGAADPIRLRYRLARRVAAVCRVAALMLCSASKQPVTVPATALLELAQRCVSAGAAPVSAVMELQAARRAFWDVRAAALRMLDALIGCCGVSLVQRATALNGLLVSALQAPPAPRPSPAAEAAHRQSLRTVRAWLTAAGAGCGLQDQAEKLITMLSEDVRPPQPAKVTLQTNPAATNGVTANPSKKKRRGAGEWLEADLSARQSAPVARRPGRCLAALEVLCQLVTALGPLLTVSAHRAAQQLCVGLLLEVQRATGAPPQPYDRPACRAGLYRLLRALVADPHPAWPAPVQFAVGLFAHGARDEDSTVSMLCQDSQALCSRIVQPTHPTLFFPVDLTAWSKPPSSTDPADGAAAPVTDPAAADGTAGFPAPAGGPAVTTDVTSVSNDVRGASEAAKDIPSDVSECGSSDTVRLGSRLGSVTAAAAAAATPADSRAGSPPGASAPSSSLASPRPAASTTGLGGGRASPPERKPPAAWLAGAAAAAGGARGEAASVTTVTIASSESSASADGRRSVELAEMEEDQKSIVLGGSEDGEEESRPTARRPAPDESDEVEILETKRPRRQTMNDDDLAPDVAEMLKDFVNEDPEVE